MVKPVRSDPWGVMAPPMGEKLISSSELMEPACSRESCQSLCHIWSSRVCSATLSTKTKWETKEGQEENEAQEDGEEQNQGDSARRKPKKDTSRQARRKKKERE